MYRVQPMYMVLVSILELKNVLDICDLKQYRPYILMVFIIGLEVILGIYTCCAILKEHLVLVLIL
jgi:hypothetical protein